MSPSWSLFSEDVVFNKKCLSARLFSGSSQEPPSSGEAIESRLERVVFITNPIEVRLSNLIEQVCEAWGSDRVWDPSGFSHWNSVKPRSGALYLALLWIAMSKRQASHPVHNEAVGLHSRFESKVSADGRDAHWIGSCIVWWMNDDFGRTIHLQNTWFRNGFRERVSSLAIENRHCRWLVELSVELIESGTEIAIFSSRRTPNI